MRMPSRIGVRLSVAVLLVLIGYFAVTRSFGIALAQADAVSALTISGSDARIKGRAAQTFLEQAKTDDDRRKAALLARQALVRDATVVPAVVTLGISLGLADGDQASVPWFDYSEKLSRRDLRTQLYFIEKAVAAADVNQALHHYDIALRTSESAPTTLYPILRAAVSDPGIQRGLAKTLAGNPLWANGFLADLAANGPDFPAAAQLFIEARRAGYSIAPDTASALLNALVAHNEVDVAWRYYVALHPGAERSAIRNADFNVTQDASSPFDWQLTNSDGVNSSLNNGGNGGILDYNLSPTVAAPVARQMIFLPAGKYRLESMLVGSSQSVGSGPYWSLQCADGKTVGKMEMGGSSARRFAAEITVPPNCSSQVLSLFVRASDDVQGASGQVDSVSLTKAN